MLLMFLNNNCRMAEVDYLDVDPLTAPDQQFALLSCVFPSDSSRENSHKFALKLRGCFKNSEDATSFLTKLNKAIPKHVQTPTFVVDVGKWLCMPPPTGEEIRASGGEEVFQEEYLQTLMKGYQDNVELKNEFFANRKEIIREKGLEQDPEPFNLHEKIDFPKPEPFVPVRQNENNDSSVLS
jgi:hypothetical protein